MCIGLLTSLLRKDLTFRILLSILRFLALLEMTNMDAQEPVFAVV
ncbi:hypothetical protein ARTSIC4J27_2186 [Pseudarthrobacter siccitolerans]|uniref:Uncharacterized protein n=1 Tax=Pseudarthrobacter siccitolerans TaxID=861266 RepID=A0A024H3B0_9MICC|nr:hypothetical protein ARTSIC4J27_2186 [Pseudarthrobacter siccitolerans]